MHVALFLLNSTRKKKILFLSLGFDTFWFFFAISQTFMSKKAVSPFVRPQVVALNDVAFNQVQISKQLKISRCFVKNTIKEFKDQGVHNDLKRSERPRKIYGHDLRYLKCFSNSWNN